MAYKITSNEMKDGSFNVKVEGPGVLKWFHSLMEAIDFCKKDKLNFPFDIQFAEFVENVFMDRKTFSYSGVVAI